MLMALELLICAGLICLGASLWWWIERRTERLVNREKYETERWRKAYTALRIGEGTPGDGLAPLPLQLDAQDQINLNTYGRTAAKRIHAQKAQA